MTSSEENGQPARDAAFAKHDAFNRLSSYRCAVEITVADTLGEDQLEEVNRLQRFIEEDVARLRAMEPEHDMHYIIIEKLLLLLDRLRAVERQY